MAEKFKLKHGWPFPDYKEGVPFSYHARSSFFIALVGGLGKMWLNWLNNVSVYNGSTFCWWVNHRPSGQPLITVSNHHSCMDDPLLHGVLPWRNAIDSPRMRWIPSAHDVVFTRQLTSFFFSSGKCVPVIRGIGVNQKGMDFCADRLKEGSWVHIFPEGKVNSQHEHLRLKWGVGRLVYDCWKGDYEPNSSTPLTNYIASKYLGKDSDNSRKYYHNSTLSETQNTTISQGSEVDSKSFIESHLKNGTNEIKYSKIHHEQTINPPLTRIVKPEPGLPGKIPVVLPIYHCGMDSVLPNKYPYIPQVGKNVTILVGEPLVFDEIIAKIDHHKLDRVQARQVITDYIQEELGKLRKKAEYLHSLKS